MKLLPLLLLLASCATSNLTADQIQWKRSIEGENWDNCEAVYEDARVYTLHMDHTHSDLDVKLHRVDSWAIRSDLMVNNCKYILGGQWIEYGGYIK